MLTKGDVLFALGKIKDARGSAGKMAPTVIGVPAFKEAGEVSRQSLRFSSAVFLSDLILFWRLNRPSKLHRKQLRKNRLMESLGDVQFSPVSNRPLSLSCHFLPVSIHILSFQVCPLC